jgi:hypothetical protein
MKRAGMTPSPLAETGRFKLETEVDERLPASQGLSQKDRHAPVFTFVIPAQAGIQRR